MPVVRRAFRGSKATFGESAASQEGEYVVTAFHGQPRAGTVEGERRDAWNWAVADYVNPHCIMKNIRKEGIARWNPGLRLNEPVVAVLSFPARAYAFSDLLRGAEWVRNWIAHGALAEASAPGEALDSGAIAGRILSKYDYLRTFGSPEVVPLSITEWNGINEVVTVIAQSYWDAHKRPLPEPASIDLAEDRSLHLLWQGGDRHILIIIDLAKGTANWFARTKKKEDARGPLDRTDVSPTLLGHMRLL